jgi:hypothetical protein
VPRVNVPGVGIVNFPDTMSEAEIAAAIPSLMPSHGQAQEQAPPIVSTGGGRGTGLDLRKSQSRMTEALPTIGSGVGAAVGGLAGPVGAVAGEG